MDKSKIIAALRNAVYPATGRDIVESGIVCGVEQENPDKTVVTLEFPSVRDPLALSVRKQVEAILAEAFPDENNIIEVLVKETAARSKPAKPQGAADIKHVIAVASGKGGVGKSTFTANLAVTLRSMGYTTGILDADIYGPSQPGMFGIRDYVPEAVVKDGLEYIAPAQAEGVEIASIGFFIRPADALAWRGPMATNALRQLIHQTRWGKLDYLLIDLPPGTGDVHLSIASELRVEGAIVVTTPQRVATDDVRRGIEMFRTPGIDIPILGIVENMAWFTPAELPDNRYYIFGRGGGGSLAQETHAPLLGQIPLVQSIMEASETGKPASGVDPIAESYYRAICEKIVEKTENRCR